MVAGARFYRGAWLQAKVGNSNMDTLVALGSTTAFPYSAWALFSAAGGHLYFMEAAAIITLISVGHWLESRVSLRASSALRQLLNLAPAMARRRDPNGAENEVPAAGLSVGDVIILKPGDRLPSDGEVVEGGSAVDESMLTGESMPIDKAVDSEVYAGTLNLNGRLIIRVTATGEGTALAHVIAAVQRAQSSRANIQRLGDRVSSVFVPIVVAWRWPPASGGGWRRNQPIAFMPRWRLFSGPPIPRKGLGRGLHHCRLGAHHCVSLRDGPRHSRCDHGRLQCRRRARYSHP